MVYLGVDVGTFETKGVLVDSDGTILAMARHRHGISTPAPGHVEQDPREDWWADVCEVSRTLMEHERAGEVRAVGLSAIGPCVVAVGEDLEPLRPAILYGVDTRATRQIADLNERLGTQAILDRGGNTLTSQSAGPKIAWIKDNEPEIWEATRWFMTSQSWLVAMMTGEVVIDHGTAGYYHPLYDLAAQAWDVTGCEDFISEDRLPRLDWTTSVAGSVHEDAAAATGIPVGTPVIVGSTDAPAEAVAAGVVFDGDLMAMYGSSGYFIRVGEQLITHDDLWAAPFVFPDTYVLAAGTATAGTATRWIVDLLDITDAEDDVTFARLLDLAQDSPAGSRGVMVLPHFAGERTPFQDPDSRGAVVGLGLDHTRSDVARAVLEGVAHSVAAAIGTYQRSDIPIGRVAAIGGGTKNPVIVDSVCAITGLRQDVADSPGAAFGDAFLAAIADGGLADRAAGSGWWTTQRTIEPDPQMAQVLGRDHAVFTDLYEALAPWNQARRAAAEEELG